MTEKRFEVWEQEPTKETTQSKVIVTVDDIIGLIKTDEPTDSVEEVRKLRGREDNNFYWYKKYKEVLNENEQLKSDNNRLVNETAKIIGEHQRKVFELIDEKIKEYIYKEKLYKYKGKDREASVFNLYCFCLNNLKKELQE